MHWGWVNSFFFPHLFQGYPLKKSTLLPKHFKPQTSPSLNSKSNVAEDGATEAMLKCCCRSLVAEVEAMLQKTLLKCCCRKRSSKKTSASVASKCTSTFLFICLFFTLVFLLKCSRWRRTCLVCRRFLHQRKTKKWRWTFRLAIIC